MRKNLLTYLSLILLYLYVFKTNAQTSSDFTYCLNLDGIAGNFDLNIANSTSINNAIQIRSFWFNEEVPTSLNSISQAASPRKALAPTLTINVTDLQEVGADLFEHLLAQTTIATAKLSIIRQIGPTTYQFVETIELKPIYVEKISTKADPGDSWGVSYTLKLRYQAVKKMLFDNNGTALTDEFLWNYTTNEAIF